MLIGSTSAETHRLNLAVFEVSSARYEQVSSQKLRFQARFEMSPARASQMTPLQLYAKLTTLDWQSLGELQPKDHINPNFYTDSASD